MATVTFQTKSKLSVVYDYSKDLGFYLVWMHSTCANPRKLKEYRRENEFKEQQTGHNYTGHNNILKRYYGLFW